MVKTTSVFGKCQSPYMVKYRSVFGKNSDPRSVFGKIFKVRIPLKTHHYPVPGRDDIRRIKQWKYVVVGVNYGLEHNNMTFK